jgi:aspartate racemase
MKTLGIIGGMGPDATVYMLSKIFEQTDAKTDQQHLETIVHSNPRVADRTAAILHNGPSPAPEMLRSARLLERAGANAIAMPCMTAHYFVDEVQREIGIPFIHAIKATADFLLSNFDTETKVAIMATSGTIASGLFQEALRKRGFDTLIPTEQSQNELVMGAIYGDKGIKAGYRDERVLALLAKAAHELVESGAGVIIAGCTEIPLVLEQEHVSVPLVDPMVVTARAAIDYCRS